MLSALDLEQIWVVPTFQNPLRDSASNSAPNERLEMVKLGLQSLSHLGERVQLKTLELERAGVSYSIDTVKEFRKENPTTEFNLIIGADQLEHFDNWRNYKALLLEANLVVTSRPGVTLPIDKETCWPWLRREVKSFSSNTIVLKSGSKIQFVKLNDVEASSTEIRRRLRRKENVSHLISASVADFAIRNKLYESEFKLKDFTEFAQYCSKILNDKGGLAVNTYDLRPLVQPTEFSIAVSGTSTRHTRALCEHVVKEAKDRFGIRPQSTEGLQEGRWIIIDYGALMIHVFYDFVRNEYKIEELWSKAARL